MLVPIRFTASASESSGVPSGRASASWLLKRGHRTPLASPEFQDVAEIYTINNALDWQLDGAAALDIEARLRLYGFDQHAISMEVYVQARDILVLFDPLLNGAQLRRLMLLKESSSIRRSRMSRLSDIGGRTNRPGDNYLSTERSY